jgi:hypothetical protein
VQSPLAKRLAPAEKNGEEQQMPSIRLTATFAASSLLAAALPVFAQRAPGHEPTRLSPEVLALACAPAVAFEMPPTPLRVTGGQDSFARRLYTTSDLLTINAGSQNAIAVGQEYFVRRAMPTSARGTASRRSPAAIQTVGWIKVYAVDDTMSLATVTHACDTIEVGDYLEPLNLPSMPASVSGGKPERDNYGRVTLGYDRRRTFGKGDFFVLDRGANEGITPGAQFVLYRDKKQAENFLYELAEAVAVSVSAETATLQITLARDSVEAGDYVALRK